MQRPKSYRYPGTWIIAAGFVFLPVFSFAQAADWRAKIDRVVQIADSLSLMSQYTFRLNKFNPANRRINEIWHYTLKDRKVIIFEVHYFVDSLEHQEVFYLDNDQLVCMEEYEIVYPPKEEDRIVWGSVGFFHNQSLLQHTTLGNPGYPLQPFQEWEAFKRFRSRFKELQENRTLVERNDKEAIFAP
ncbi:hypothetical protein [Flavihumibacter profundi]|uniref:hypothetical protein n=1 Tax=Flavihumibacter profundi TaxID=2716883 RepID=UPI001CC7297C|nr:hypothetical protein [Flavihumibacter profundi]MBZ5857139.1 hypothetical protein [Flavihumibacter profundi]